MKFWKNALVMVVWVGCAVAAVGQATGGNAPAPMAPPATGTGAGQQTNGSANGQRSGVIGASGATGPSGVIGVSGATGGRVPEKGSLPGAGTAGGGGVRSDADTRTVRDGRGSTATPGVGARVAKGASGSAGATRSSRRGARGARVSGAKQTAAQEGATDEEGLASPVRGVTGAPVTDSAAEASPTSGEAHVVTIPAGTKLRVRSGQALSSASAKNGETLRGTLVSAVRSSAGVLGAGTAVVVTVVEAAPAGTMESAGEFSLQAIKVGGVKVASMVVVRKGVEGRKELADSAPAKGTEAVMGAGDVVEFLVPDVTMR